MATGEEICFTDLAQCKPRSAIADRNCKGCWRAVSYAAAELSGTLLLATPESAAEAVTLSLNASGWHAVHLGLWAEYGSGLPPSTVEVQLTNDPSPVTVRGETQSQYEIEEVFWKCADLTGQAITFSQLPGGFRAGIAHVRLVPLSVAEVDALQADRQRGESRRLIFTVDAHGMYYYHHHRGIEDIHRVLEPFRDTDFGKVIWNNGGSADSHSFPTKVGRLANQDCECYPRFGSRVIGDNMRFYQERGIDTMAVARDFARDLGLEFHCSIRMGAFQFQPPYDEVFTSPFYLEHPEWHCRDYDGVPVSRLSYAHPEVREYVLSLLAELAAYEPDGLSLIFLRGDPFMLYEAPLLAGFREHTGKDALALPPNAPAFLRYRCGVMTGFIRQVRALCDQRRMALSAFAFCDEQNNMRASLDPETWVKDGLVDFLVPYPRTAGEGRSSLEGLKLQPVDMAYYARIAAGMPCEVYPEMTRPAREFDDNTPAAYQRQMLAAYSGGAAGATFWDGGGMTAPRTWSMIRRLGHKAELAGFDDGEGVLFRSLPLSDVGGYRMDRHPPHWAF